MVVERFKTPFYIWFNIYTTSTILSLWWSLYDKHDISKIQFIWVEYRVFPNQWAVPHFGFFLYLFIYFLTKLLSIEILVITNSLHKTITIKNMTYKTVFHQVNYTLHILLFPSHFHFIYQMRFFLLCKKYMYISCDIYQKNGSANAYKLPPLQITFGWWNGKLNSIEMMGRL